MAKTIYFLVPYPAGQAPSQRFRFEQYIRFLGEQGFTVEELSFLDEKTWKLLYQQGKAPQKALGMIRSFFRRFLVLFELRKADYLFIHREMAQLGPPVFEWIVAKILRRKYIYDFDDAIWLPNYSETNKRYQRLKAYWKVNYCMKWAYKVTAGNEYLANYARQFNSAVFVLPTTIDTLLVHNQLCDQDAEKVTIGWTGTHTTMHYLDALLPVLQELEEKYDFTFLVISNEKPEFELRSLEFVKWNKATEIADLSRMQIGVMPLENDQWAAGKCGFKGLQYMALGITAVMSPVGVNTQIVQHGENGFLAETVKEWHEILEKLLKDSSLRKKAGENGRKTVEDHYSVLAWSDFYLSLFN